MNTTYLSGIITLRQNLQNIYWKLSIRRILWKFYLLTKKGLHFDTIEGFYIYNEETFNNQLNYKHDVCSKKYSYLLPIREDADTSPPYPYTFTHSLTPTIPPPSFSPHTSLPVTTFDRLAGDCIRQQRLQDDGRTFWILETVLL